MFSIKKAGVCFLLLFLFTMATWSVGEAPFSFRSVLKLMDPSIDMDRGVSFALLALHLGPILLFVREIGESIDGFFSLQQYILVKRGNGYFVVKCLQYVLKNTLLLWCVWFAVEILISVGEVSEQIGRICILNGSILLTLLVWIGIWMLLKLIGCRSKSIMVVLILLISIATYFSHSLPGEFLALCPAELFAQPVMVIGEKVGLLFVLVVSSCCILKKYESIGG